MPSPIVLIALAAGAYWLLKKDDKKPTASASGTLMLPSTTADNQAPTTIQLPTQVISDADVQQTHTPSVTLTVPKVVADTTTSTTPGIAEASKVTTTPAIPIGTAKFPDMPSGPVTPQQVATAILPQLVSQATTAIQTATNTAVAANPNLTPLHTEEVQVDQDPNGTVTLAKAMINAEGQSGWKKALATEITLWQSHVGLKADGKFGPASAQRMATEVGILPLIRYFPSSSASKAAALKSYRDAIYTMAANAENNNPPQAAALRLSADYDQGQGWATNPAAVPASERVAQATALQAAIKGAA